MEGRTRFDAAWRLALSAVLFLFVGVAAALAYSSLRRSLWWGDAVFLGVIMAQAAFFVVVALAGLASCWRLRPGLYGPSCRCPASAAALASWCFACASSSTLSVIFAANIAPVDKATLTIATLHLIVSANAIWLFSAVSRDGGAEVDFAAV
jgi:hypothetical protein